jgi:hypothetical protein
MSAQSHTGDTAVLDTYGAERLLEQGDQRAVFTATREEVHTAVTLSAIRSMLHTCTSMAWVSATLTVSSHCVTPLSSCSQTATHSLDDHLSLRQPLQRVRRATSHTAIRVHATRAVRDGEGARTGFRWEGVVGEASPHHRHG